MKRVKMLLVLAVLSLSCGKEAVENVRYFANSDGRVHVVACSRGCYQFILRTPPGDLGQTYYLTNFPDSLKNYAFDASNSQRELEVLFSGKTLKDKQLINTAGPDDGAIPAYELPVIQVDQISRKR